MDRCKCKTQARAEGFIGRIGACCPYLFFGGLRRFRS